MAACATSVTFFSVSAAQAEPSPVAAPAADRQDPTAPAKVVEHNLKGPFSEQQAQQRKAALDQVLTGKKDVEQRGASKVVKLDEKKYVELGREKTDKIFTILVEFGDQVDNTTMHDPDGPGPKPEAPKYGGTPGPMHNTIAQPDRKLDNSTAWRADFSRSYFQDLYFGTGKGKDSLKTYYEKTSSGRYSVEGEVSDWVKVPYNEARYGSNYCGQTNCSNVWDTVKDGVLAWTEAQKKAGKTDAQIKALLAQYDLWDRYDFDGDGNFNESDGYIDHFQIVHAGEDESAGGGVQGTTALWAHRWYAYGTSAGKTGPANNKAGGTQIGDTGIWVGDYTMQPENGGLGVFAHEYGHDLGLPDLYDTSGGGENGVGFWSLMSAGSWLGKGKDSIGDLPGDMTAWDKLQLGWLNYDKAKAATKSTHKLGVSAYNTKDKQALVVELPKKKVQTDVVAPAEGSSQWWSNMGDDLKNTLTRSVDLTGKKSAALSLKGWWDIEAEYDYLYTEVSTDGGANWTALAGTADGVALPADAGGSPSLTGVSGTWKSLNFPLDAYAGKKVDVRFRYQTDGGAGGKGFTADAVNITADGSTVFADGAENGDNGWTGKGFSRIGAGFTKEYAQYYLAENRRYVSYDSTLKVGPYNFGFGNTRPDWVEHYPYQDGLLIWQWDTSQKDNNTSQHPGQGLILPVDANAKPMKWADGTLLRNKIQPYDATFSAYSTDAFTLHKNGEELFVKPKPTNLVFDDRKGKYYYDENPTGSVKVTDTNTKIKILKEAYDGLQMTVEVGPSK
ncbi:immune inhibitor A domain-containing protein [Streptomyces antarcticus]|uniref:immune inhibitor A domain-containing protein n=1 Tax=Streptomyces antarcticus TaxID=2996458 RepID=UPI00226F83C9|nr:MULTISPECIES: immune inhibitor A domain-containing protein [unclassified Streptomyces]MCY0944578.1 immune inhibitor A [Streptomyces sp. H34-AA3]MCY0949053.1 immune inhibitor A [Streptomyces sp. H27-S2]MCZ4088095.1 immune inhibitor A [Streptomyces sp. H34-S5]